MVTNPPYGERINPEDIENLYRTLGTKIKRVFLGYHCWVISSNEDCLAQIGLTPSVKEELQNGGIDCQLREYVSFEGSKSDFRKAGGTIKETRPTAGDDDSRGKRMRKNDAEWRKDARERGLGGKTASPRGRKERPERRGPEKRTPLSEKYIPKKGGYARNEEHRRKFKEETARESEAEQLLQRRRNIHALKSLGEMPKRPSLPAAEGPFMRTRRKWKRPDTDNTNNNNNEE